MAKKKAKAVFRIWVEMPPGDHSMCRTAVARSPDARRMLVRVEGATLEWAGVMRSRDAPEPAVVTQEAPVRRRGRRARPIST